jgi:aspartate racemase
MPDLSAMNPRTCLLLFRVLVVGSALGLCSCAHHGVAPKRMVGIFGGMGPEATANLYSEIVKLTPAKKDQDHLPTLIYSLPQVPDRTTCIQSGSREIVPYVQEGVRRLERMGASFIVIPCNTVHYYYDDMQKAVRIPVLHMINETVDAVQREHPQCKTVGLLATNGTVRSKLYENAFLAKGIRVVYPDDQCQQNCVMSAVYSIKSGGAKEKQAQLLARAADDVTKKGAGVIVLGCTEIPLAFDTSRARLPVVNATRVLAQAAIREYGRSQ